MKVERFEAGPWLGVRVIYQDKLYDPRLGTAGDNPAHWNREKTPADKLPFSHCGVFLCTDVSVNQFSVSLIQLSVSDAATIKWVNGEEKGCCEHFNILFRFRILKPC